MRKVSTTISMTTVYDGADGLPGVDGMHSAVVQLFKRDTAVPDKPTGPLTYEFASGLLTGNSSHFNGWSHEVPQAQSDGKKLYITMATAASTEATATIEAHEWATPVEYVANGMHSASVAIYKRAATQPQDGDTNPDRPKGDLTYTFATGELTGNINWNGWAQEIPATNGLPCWMRHATAVASGLTDTIEPSEWSKPAIKLIEDGKGYRFVFSTFSAVYNVNTKTFNGGFAFQVVRNTGGVDAVVTEGEAQWRFDEGTWASCDSDYQGTYSSDINFDGQTLNTAPKTISFRLVIGNETVATESMAVSITGEHGKGYGIELASGAVRVNKNGITQYANVSGTVFQMDGATRKVIDLTASGNYILCAFGNTSWRIVNSSGGAIANERGYFLDDNLGDIDGQTWAASQKSLIVTLYVNYVSVASQTIPLAIDGNDGQGTQGPMGASIRGPRQWAFDTFFNDGTVVESDGFRYLDIIVYNNTIRKCIQAHTSPTILDQYYWSTYWVTSSQFSFVATELLYSLWARIEQLEAKFVRVEGDNGVNVLIGNNGLQIYKGSILCLDIGVNEDKDAVLQIYSGGQLVGRIDKNLFNTKAYGSSFTERNLYTVLTGDIDNIGGQIVWSDVESVYGGTTYYQWQEGYSVSGDGTRIYNISGNSTPSKYNSALFTSKSITNDHPYDSNMIADGWYCGINKGVHKAYLDTSGNPVYTERLYKYVSGRLAQTAEIDAYNNIVYL